MSKSRHTPIGQTTLRRSYGITGNEDLVVSLHPDNRITIHKEPTDRKLRRGEELPEIAIDIEEAWANRVDDTPVSDLESRIDRVVRKLPIADLSGPPEKVGYIAKSWLMRELKAEFGQNEKHLA